MPVADPAPSTPYPDKPDDLLLKLVSSVFGQGLIWYLLGLIVFLMAWFGFLKGVVQIGRNAAASTVALYRGVQVRPRAQRIFLIVTTTLLVALQCAWLFLAFTVGNMISFALEERDTPVVPLGFDGIDTAPGPLRFDNISMLYLFAAIAVLCAAAYRETKTDDGIVRFWSLVVGIPALWWGVPTGLVVILDSVSVLFIDGKHFLAPDIQSPAIIAATAVAYLATCCTAVYCSVLLARLWHTPAPVVRDRPGFG